MSQIARNLTHSVDGLLTGKRYLIHDRNPLLTDEFLRTLKGAGVESVKLPPRSPNLNAHAERFVRSIKEGCLERLILFGESSLRTAVQNFMAHFTANATISSDERIVEERRWGMAEPHGVASRRTVRLTTGRVRPHSGEGLARDGAGLSPNA